MKNKPTPRRLRFTGKKLILSALLFFIVIMLLGIPFTDWWLSGCDDGGGIFVGYKTKGLKDLFYYFYDGNIEPRCTSNRLITTTNIQTSFFSTYYRPLYCIYHAIQYWLFGTNIYLYHLTNVFFHAINTALLFNILIFLISFLPAFLGALFFAFHPQIGYRFGAVVNFHYYINVTLILLLFLFFKKYLDSKKNKFYIVSCILFILSLFTRESTIILPAIILPGTYLYENRNENHLTKNFFKQFLYYLKLTLPFTLITIGFLSWRAYLYPIKFLPTDLSNENFLSKIALFLKAKIAGLQVFAYDFLGLSWLPWGHKMIRGIIVLSLLMLLFYFFIKNTKKIYILYFLFATALMLWPAFLGNNYCPRYFYEAHPFAILALIFLFKHYKDSFKFRKIGFSIFSLMIIFYATFAVECFSLREKKMKIMKTAFNKLIENPKIKNSTLCFLGCPLEGYAGTVPFFLVTLDNPDMQIYEEPSTIINQVDSNIVKPVGWRNKISEYYDENFLTITPVQNGYRLTSQNYQKVNFYNNDDCALGKKIVHQIEIINGEKVITDFTLKIDSKYLDKKPMFITWDYVSKDFVFLEQPKT